MDEVVTKDDLLTLRRAVRTCEALGLDDMPRPGQTDPHG